MKQGAHTVFGRDAELKQLDSLLEAAGAGSSRFVVVGGEPGIGKTFLLAELARRADARGWLVLGGRATELERELPFGLVVHALDDYLEALDARAFDRLAADGLGELAAVFPSMRALRPPGAEASTVAERFRAHRAVRELVERLAARQPFLLSLDDLQWSDGASAELIAHLLRRPPDAAVLVAASMRTGRADPMLAGAIEAAARDGDVVQIALGPLGPDAAAALVGSDASDGFDGFYEQSGGNPFYLLALARARSETSAEAGSDWDPAGVPAPVAAAITAELDGFPEHVRDFARAAAVAGDPFELDLAVATAGIAEADALAALDELIARDVVRPSAAPREFTFRHPLVRIAVYASCPPGVRIVAHERTAAALADHGAPAVARAHHVEQCARHGDAGAVAVLREAGLATAARAPASSGRWLEAALRILPGTAPADERAELLMSLASARAATGRLEDCRAALLQAIDLAGLGGSPSVRLISACAGVEQLLGRAEDARTRLQVALDALPDRVSPDGASLMIDLAVDAFYRADFATMVARASAALDAARARDDSPLTAASGALLAFGESCVGQTADAQRHRDEVARLVDGMPDDMLAARLDAVAWLSSAEFYLDRFSESAAHARRGLAVARATGQGDLFPVLTQALGNVLFCTGRPVEAGELLDGAVEAARLVNHPVALAWTLLNRSYAATLAGDVEVALRCSDEADALTRGLEGSVVAVWTGATLAAATDLAGNPARAAETLVAAAGGPDLALMPGAWRANWLERLTHFLVAAGRLDEARRAAAACAACAEQFGLGLAACVAARAAAAVSLADGDGIAAADLALRSAAAADEVGAPLEAAFSRELAGRALAAAGQRARAVEELERAAETMDACRALRHRDRAEHELRQLGQAIHRRSRAGADGAGVAALSGRELEVARLVVDRRTNGEIAAELFLSVKTVESHLRNIFRKLDASSRVDVARMVERADREGVV
jgi:DNA-binding NarL/FixJ family response regulator/tetratricopeptide (TPR) repeat protein